MASFTSIPVTPLFLKDVEIIIAGSDYGAAVSSVTLTPSTSSVSFKGLKPTAVFTQQTSPTWTCDIAYAQDWDSETSLSWYLLNHVGDTVDATISPKSASGPSFAVKLVIGPGAIGGAVDTFGTSTVSLGMSGAPTKASANPS